MADGSAPVIGLAGKMETRISFPDNRAMVGFCGPCDRNLTELERQFGVTILRHGNSIRIQADRDHLAEITEQLEDLARRAREGEAIDPGMSPANPDPAIPALVTRRRPVEPRTRVQANYVRALHAHEVNFGIGPAGTGKTYLAVAAGVSLFLQNQVERLVLSRPAVEAGERLGFLPGDMKDKVDPYMQPLYDALNDMLPAKQVQKMLEEKSIEIAPLAFMRGRTLSNAFVVLDEAQNATAMQMKMFLTRLGRGSRMVVTGDPGQVDLPKGVVSGLVDAERILDGVEGVGFTRFTCGDVVRHPLVARILAAYDGAEAAV
ncbi:PhoH family protein [Defluviimonas salinarum]|uniref:PhoH-like protein n=1 Tax=Defluviimonas salinarum TaxID=2992147 RepID=A0ABT3J490_9RHOB|nr:PhoH family protein [Defluviimonas salinarum]MCW3782512.1 PhoH family protein [Defluviimonas salinarum]